MIFFNLTYIKLSINSISIMLFDETGLSAAVCQFDIFLSCDILISLLEKER